MGFSFEQFPAVEVEGIEFPQQEKAVGSLKPTFLAGAGVRGLTIGGTFVAFTAIGVYGEESLFSYLQSKWASYRSPQDLQDNLDFFMDIVTCPFLKFIRVTMIKPLSGSQYSGKVCEGCIALWEAAGVYGEEKALAVEEFKGIFSEKTMAAGSSILFTVSPEGLLVAFAEGSSLAEISEVKEMKNRAMGEALLATMIGENAVSPQTKASIADRFLTLYLPAVQQAKSEDLPAMEIEGNFFPSTVTSPGATQDLILAGAGVRGLTIEGNFIPVTTIGVYMDREIVSNQLMPKWKGKSAEELNEDENFILEIITSSFPKMAQVSLLRSLPGPAFCAKVADNCRSVLEKAGRLGESETKAIQEFTEAFVGENLPAKGSVVFVVSPSGLGIAISREPSSMARELQAKIGNRSLAEAVLLSIIGKDGVSPHARASVASRLSSLLKH